MGPSPSFTPSAALDPSRGSLAPETGRPSASAPALAEPPRTVRVDRYEIQAPIEGRISPSGVWTGSEVLVWGGWIWDEEGVGISGAAADGVAYHIKQDRWRAIPEAPIEARARHLAAWTGREMLVWGGLGRAAPDGAAFNPAAGSWRVVADAPLKWTDNTASVWTGDEWVIAIGRRDAIDVAAYNPASDTWRALPSPAIARPHEMWLAWTRSELVLVDTTAGTYVLAQGSSEWTEEGGSGDASGPIATVGDRLFGTTYSVSGGEAAQWVAGSGWEIVPGQRPVSHALSTGDRVVYLRGGAAFDPSSKEWVILKPYSGIGRVDHVEVWAGDRLVVWGGWRGGPGVPFASGVVLVPEW
jgi:hypothetical protein